MLLVTLTTLDDLARAADAARVALETTVLDMHRTLQRLIPGRWVGDGMRQFELAYGNWVAAADDLNQLLLAVEKTIIECERVWAEVEERLDGNFRPPGGSGGDPRGDIYYGLDGPSAVTAAG